MFVSLRQASHWIVPLRVNKSFYNSVLDSGIGIGIALVLFVPGKPGVLGKSIWRGDFGKKPALDLSKSKPEVSKKAQGPKPKQNIKESGTRRSFTQRHPPLFSLRHPPRDHTPPIFKGV